MRDALVLRLKGLEGADNFDGLYDVIAKVREGERRGEKGEKGREGESVVVLCVCV